MKHDIVKSLEELINNNINEIDFPHVKGNSIRIKHMVVRKSPKGFLVYDTKDNKQIARLFCKASAIALAKSCAQGKSLLTEIVTLDKNIEKFYNDCVFYKHTIIKTKDPIRRDIFEIRFDEAKFQTNNAKSALDKIIFA